MEFLDSRKSTADSRRSTVGQPICIDVASSGHLGLIPDPRHFLRIILAALRMVDRSVHSRRNIIEFRQMQDNNIEMSGHFSTTIPELNQHLIVYIHFKFIGKDYRAALQTTEWEKYSGKYVAITCTADAVIPMWAYMLAANYLQPVAKEVVFGNEAQLISTIITRKLANFNGEDYIDKRVVVKGCGEVSIPESAYVEITARLRPFAKSIMYGEPCSTVPIYKKPMEKKD